MQSTVEECIDSSNTDNTFSIESYRVYEAKNVVSIFIKTQNQEGWDIVTIPNPETSEVAYYFYFDCEQSDAFGHWVFESAYYLPLFKKLKQQYPTLQLLSYKKKNFMKSMFEAFDMKESDIVHEISCVSNRVFFPEFSTLALHTPYQTFLDHIHRFYTSLVEGLPSPTKCIDILYLPRGRIENFKPNDRTIPCQEQLVDLLPMMYPSSRIYYTDQTKNMRDQIELVRSARILIVDYGSNLMFNGFFAEDSIVLVIGNIHRHLENPRPYQLILDSETRGVKYYYLPGNISAMEVLQSIEYLQSHTAPSFKHELACWKKCALCTS